MDRLLAIDPGVKGCGVALFEEGELRRAAYVKALDATGGPCPWAAMAYAVEGWLDEVIFRGTLLLERPQVYAGRNRKGADPNDLIDLAGVLGALTVALAPTRATFARPAEWKGQVPKPARRSQVYIIETRVRRALSLEENSVISDVGPRWDTIDAVGLGLWYLRRLHTRVE